MSRSCGCQQPSKAPKRLSSSLHPHPWRPEPAEAWALEPSQGLSYAVGHQLLWAAAPDSPDGLKAWLSPSPGQGLLAGPATSPRFSQLCSGRAALPQLPDCLSHGAALLLLLPDTRVWGLMQPARLSFGVSVKKLEAWGVNCDWNQTLVYCCCSWNRIADLPWSNQTSGKHGPR